MYPSKPPSPTPAADHPRHPQQEIADLLAAALLRLRARQSGAGDAATAPAKDAVGLGFIGHQRVNVNPDHHEGVRP